MKNRLVISLRNRIPSHGSWILVVSLCCPGLYGQTNEPPAVKAGTSQANQAVVDEINEIRKQLGGGIEEQLRGLGIGKILDSQLKNDFEQELKQLAAQDAKSLKSGADPGTTPDAAPSVDHAGFSDLRQKNRAQSLAQSRIIARMISRGGQSTVDNSRFVPKDNNHRFSGDTSHIFNFSRPPQYGPAAGAQPGDFPAANATVKHSPLQSLRSAARRLDEISAELEDVGLYPEADSAREQARSFWLKARELGNKAQSANSLNYRQYPN